MIKRINSSTGNFEDQVTDTLVLDTVPTVNSFNTVTSDGIARAIAGASGEVPQVTENDNGKVLTAIYDAGGPAVEWSTKGQVPSSTSEDSGKVLTVDPTGTPAWKVPSGDSEWWGGEPEPIVLEAKQIRLLFKNSEYDPRNDTDTSFLNRFTSITKENDGSYTFQFKKGTGTEIAGQGYRYASAAFNNKYTIGDVGEFVILAWNPELLSGETVVNDDYFRMFNLCTGLRAVYNVMSYRNTQQASGFEQQTNCYSAFGGCVNLKTYRELATAIESGYAPLNNFYIENGARMFQGCVNLEDVCMFLNTPTRTHGTPANFTYEAMFDGCEKLKVGPQIMGGVPNCRSMFSGCYNLVEFCSLPQRMTTNTYSGISCDCAYMFYKCKSLTDVSALGIFFSRINISDADLMFDGCVSLLSIPFFMGLDSSGVHCQQMFGTCLSLRVLPELEYTKVSYAADMFRCCYALTDVSALSSITWSASLTNVNSMFFRCLGVRTGLLACYNSLSANSSITGHTNTFFDCGGAFSNPDLANIPSSWGGTGT